jgi:hypothetical protein
MDTHPHATPAMRLDAMTMLMTTAIAIAAILQSLLDSKQIEVRAQS